MFKRDRGSNPNEKRRLPAHARLALTVVVVASVLSVGSMGTVVAHNTYPADPGASGSCEHGGDGGSFETHVGDYQNSQTDPAEAESTVAMVTYFAETTGECGSESEDEGDYYIEVHVGSTAAQVQYCYSERSDGDEGDSGHGGDATDPATAGAGAGEINANDGTHKNYPKGEGFCDYNRDDEETGACDPLQPSAECDKEERFP